MTSRRLRGNRRRRGNRLHGYARPLGRLGSAVEGGLRSLRGGRGRPCCEVGGGSSGRGQRRRLPHCVSLQLHWGLSIGMAALSRGLPAGPGQSPGGCHSTASDQRVTLFWNGRCTRAGQHAKYALRAAAAGSEKMVARGDASDTVAESGEGRRVR